MSIKGFVISDDALLADLTAPQREAVTHVEGPLLVLAGAGSGKTRVITRRAAYLIAHAEAAHRVLAVTFTNKAAEELIDRLQTLGVGEALTACTFHSLCARLLRIHHERACLAPNFTIFDQADRQQVVKKALLRCELKESNFSPSWVEERISRAKNAMITATMMTDQAYDWGERVIARLYAAYEELLAENQALDFDDLLLRVAFLLQTDAELRSKLEDRYRYVLVDEYQDTNAAQYEIARLLTLDKHRLCATGDPDQSIYKWRGADIGNILRYEQQYPEARIVRLEQNYRSTKRILAVADALISRNVERKHKDLWTHNPEGVAIRLVEVPDAESEARWLATDMHNRIADGRRPSDMAVFYRTNSLSRPIEEALLTAGIPYQVARGVALYGRKEIKDLLAYVRVLVNPADAVSLLRIINTPTRGIGQTTLDRLAAAADKQGQSLHSVVMAEKLPPGLGVAASRVTAFAALLRSLQPLSELRPGECLRAVFSQSGMQAALREEVDDQESESESKAVENVLHLIETADQFAERSPEASLLDWLSHTSLLGDADLVNESAGLVTLMTLHAAKGLEFPVVYIVGLEEGLIPFTRPGDEGEDLEEERRLCFVGMTRAQEELTLTRALLRMTRGQTLRTTASPFLYELPQEHIERISLTGRGSGAYGGADLDSHLPYDLEQWEIGSLVRHPEHGYGTVVDLNRYGGKVLVRVQFNDGERRAFNLGYADLQRVDYTDVD